MLTAGRGRRIRGKLIDLGIAKIARRRQRGADRRRRVHRQAAVRLARAVRRRPSDRRPQRPLLLRDRALRAADRGSPLRRRDDPRDRREPAQPAAAPLPQDRSQGPPVAGGAKHRPESAARKPGDRYQTASEFGKSLEALAAADLRGESASAVLEYVDKAMMLALLAGRRFGRQWRGPATHGEGALRSARFAGSVGVERPEGPQHDREVGRADAPAARRRGRDPPAAGAEEIAAPRGPVETASTRPVAGAPEPEARRPHFAGYLVAAALAALLVGFGVWIAGRDRRVAAGNEEPGREHCDDSARERSGAAVQPRTSDAKNAGPAAEAPAAVPAPEPTVAVAVAPTIVEREAHPRGRFESEAHSGPARGAPPSDKRGPGARNRGRRRERLRRRRPAPSLPRRAAIPHAVLPPVRRHGLQAGDRPGRPRGILGRGHQGARPDSGLMRINVALSAERPMDDQPFFVTVRFEKEATRAWRCSGWRSRPVAAGSARSPARPFRSP